MKNEISRIREVRYDDPTASAELARAALKQTQDETARILFANELASSLRALGQLDVAEQILEITLGYALGLPRIEADVYRRLSLVAMDRLDMRSLEKAEDLACKAIANAFLCGDLEGAGKGLHSLGTARALKCQWAGAIRAFDAALGHTTSPTDRFLFLLSRFRAAQSVGQDGTDFLREMIELGDGHRFWHLAAWIEGDRLAADSHFSEAAKLFSRLRSVHSERNEVRDAALAGALAVQAHWRAGDRHSALGVALSLAIFCDVDLEDNESVPALVSAALAKDDLLPAAARAEKRLRAVLSRPKAF